MRTKTNTAIPSSTNEALRTMREFPPRTHFGDRPREKSREAVIRNPVPTNVPAWISSRDPDLYSRSRIAVARVTRPGVASGTGPTRLTLVRDVRSLLAQSFLARASRTRSVLTAERACPADRLPTSQTPFPSRRDVGQVAGGRVGTPVCARRSGSRSHSGRNSGHGRRRRRVCAASTSPYGSRKGALE